MRPSYNVRWMRTEQNQNINAHSEKINMKTFSEFTMSAFNPTPIQQVENILRDELSGTNRVTTANLMFSKDIKKLVNRSRFNKIWKSLIDDGFLVSVGSNRFKWEI